MSGEMPNWIGNTTLRMLAMGNNSFKGQLPCEVVALKFFDISHNALSGSLPSCEYPQFLEHLHLQGNRFTGVIPEDFLNSLSLLTLDIRDNSLNGSIPSQLWHFQPKNSSAWRKPFKWPDSKSPMPIDQISLMDLSNNSFSGSILGYLDRYFYINGDIYDEQDEVEFVTKYRSGSYKGDILNFMSGLDLSRNNLTSEIPHELGNLSSLHALNLSHNELQAPSRKAVFTVVHNNFSGRVPDLKQQFGTFDETSYDGNPFLCGPLLKKKCSINPELPYSPVALSDMKEVKWYDIDRVVFSASFAAAYITILLAFATALYVNPIGVGETPSIRFHFNSLTDALCNGLSLSPSLNHSRKSYLEVTSQRLARGKLVHFHGWKSLALPSVGPEGTLPENRLPRGTISHEKNGVCEISQTLKRVAKSFRNNKLNSQGCEVGFHLEVPSFLLAVYVGHLQEEIHPTVQKGCGITSQQKGDFAALCKMLPSAWSDWLVMAATSSFQLRIVHRLKHWIVDFLRFEMVYSMHHLDFRKCPKSGCYECHQEYALWQILFAISPCNPDLLLANDF
ncbi:Receptor protein kinase CLAVATA1 [Vitis vinifera]|uniref:Receptor protein kinase CLAVATA1 n=1 Tax=Vitis vinifera TaxID=29760 RepID=A0A438HI67_VITVI|nr:Receptor protein kinase CLAVATA1 [Vitis vinifera]